MNIEMFLPLPPTINSYYKKSRSHVRLSDKGRQFREEVSGSLLAQLGSSFVLPFEAPYSITIVFYPPDKRRRDIDNMVKPLLDAITHAGIWEDDCLVNHLEIYRGTMVKPSGCCYVRIGEAGPLIPEPNRFNFNLLG